MTYVDIQLVLVGLVAMLEPATLGSSVLALVLGDRPRRTGLWFYLGGLGVTLAVGVLAAFVLGNTAASRTSTPKTWVSIFGLIAGLLLLAYVVWTVRRPVDPEATGRNIERMSKVASAPGHLPAEPDRSAVHPRLVPVFVGVATSARPRPRDADHRA